jgi:hypothetical protein
MTDKRWIPIYEITTKELQLILKNVLNKVTAPDLSCKLGFQTDEIIDVINLRRGCRNSKLRLIYFRLIHNDFFTFQRMFKYKMTNSPNCPRSFKKLQSTYYGNVPNQ